MLEMWFFTVPSLRLRRVKGIVSPGSLDAGARCRADGWRVQVCTASRKNANCFNQCFGRYAFEEVAARACSNAADKGTIVLECRQKQSRRQPILFCEDLQHVHSIQFGHAHIEEKHIGIGSHDRGDSRLAIRGFGKDLNSFEQAEQGAKTSAHQRLIVNQADPDQ
jgi:hypothetical protein